MSVANLFAQGKAEVQKILNWMHGKEPDLIQAFQEAHTITSAAIAWRNSPNGIAVVTFVESQIPKSVPYFDEATKIAVILCKDMEVCSSKAGIEGVALRLGGELSAIIHGKKLPNGVSEYISEFQKIFMG